MEMNKLLVPYFFIACLIFTSCDDDEVISQPMEWTYDILTPENVKYEGGGSDLTPEFRFRANGKGGDVVMTCKNYDNLDPILGNSDTYDCGWAKIKVEANQLKIHFPYNVSDMHEAKETVTVSANNGKKKVNTIISLVRTFEEEVEPGPGPQPLPEKYKFKLVKAGFSSFMNDDFILPAPFEQFVFRITDIDGNYNPIVYPEFTEYYDSIVWCAEGYPNTVRVYNVSYDSGSLDRDFLAQWSSYFFKNGTVKTTLKGYREGKVEYTDKLDIALYERDFLCYDWTNGSVILANPSNLTAFCMLDTRYEYVLTDTEEANGVRYSEIIPVNNKYYTESEFLIVAQEAIKTLMKNNVGDGQKADGKESLFKCLPAGAEAELFWENKTTRMLMLHQLPNDLKFEKYYLYVESK